MTEIKPPNRPPLSGPSVPQESAAPSRVAVDGSTATLSDHEVRPHYASIDHPLAEPVPPSTTLDERGTAGAAAFASQLRSLGSMSDDSDLLLARFLKLQVLSETNDLWGQLLAREAHSLLMRGAIQDSKLGNLKDAARAFERASEYRQRSRALAQPYQDSSTEIPSEVQAEIGALLAKASAEDHRGRAIESAFAQGLTMSQMRKGQHNLDSIKRLSGHDVHLRAVLLLFAGTASADEKLESLRLAEDLRLRVTSLVENSADEAYRLQLNKRQPVPG